MDLLQGPPPYADGRHLFEARVTARIIIVEEAAAETRAAIAHAYAIVKTLPTEFYQPISDAITEVISTIHNEALSRLLATALSFATAPSYDSVLILPDEWIHGVGEEKPDALV